MKPKTKMNTEPANSRNTLLAAVGKSPVDLTVEGDGNVKTLLFSFEDGSVGGFRIAVKHVYDAIDKFTSENICP
jgi:hypothetical protein